MSTIITIPRARFAKMERQLAAVTAQRDELLAALREINGLHGEINPSNYDHDDACELNKQFCYAGSIASAAIAKAQ